MSQVCPSIESVECLSLQAINPAQLYRFTIAEHERLYETGILGPEVYTELIHGIVLNLISTSPPHAACINRLARDWVLSLQKRAIVSVKNPLNLGKDSQPQPDLVLLQRADDFYASDGPKPTNVLLLIEVADFTAKFDREVKGPLYARSGIGEFWLVDLEHRKLEVYRDPSPEGYQTKFTLTATDQAACLAFPEELIALSEILG
jgi:Uma2 family endonuclease